MNTVERVLAAVVLLAVVAWAQAASTDKPGVSLRDEDEVRVGKLLAAKFAKIEGLQATPQTTKIEKYLQTVGDRLAAHAQRKLPYRFHFDPDPSFKSAFALP